MDIVVWLRSLGLGRYEAAFRENEIDETVLPNLTAEDLKDLGVSVVGHRRKLFDAIAALRAHAGVKAPSSDAATTTSAPPVSSEDRAERRQVTVMFSDLVGSTALSARMDPEDLREVISAYQKCVAETVRRFGGFVANYMGDGVLVYFGYPEAHEDDAERAVRAGLELIAAVSALQTRASLQTRVGIATGLVVVGDVVGSGEAQEHGIVGETPNLAARLQGIAEPNTVVIAEATRRLLGNLFELEDLGARELKGVLDPVRAWVTLRASAVESRFDALHASGLTALVGREEETELLLRRWSRAKSGEGQVVLLSGEPGIGKSRLTATLLESLASEPHTRLRYFCSPQHTDSALYPIIGQMERAAGLAHEDSAKARLDKLDVLLAQTSTCVEDTALLAEMLSLSNDGRYPSLDKLTSQQRRDWTLQVLVSQTEALARRNPVLMIFEDAHWTDPTSLEVFSRVVDRIATLRVVLIVTFRPEFEPPWIGRPHVTTLTLNRLAQREVGAIIDGVVGNKLLPANIRQDIIERSDGIPLFIEEMTKAVLEADSQGAAEQTIAAIPSSFRAVPASLHASLIARLDRLGAAKEVAQIGAAMGREFSRALLTAVARKPDVELGSALDRLIASGLLFRQGVPPQESYLFKHALVQDAAYSTLLRDRRRALHARIAEALERQFPERAKLEPELLARHFAEAGDSTAAVAYWLKGGIRAAERSANHEAEQHLKRGLDLLLTLPSSPERDSQELEFQLTLGSSLTAVRGWANPEVGAVRARSAELSEKLGQTEHLLYALYGQFAFSVNRGKTRIGVELARRCRSLGNDAKTKVVGCRALGVSLMQFGQFQDSRVELEELNALHGSDAHRELARQLIVDPFATGDSCLALTLWALGYPAQAMIAGERAISTAARLDHLLTTGYALFFAGAQLSELIGDRERTEMYANKVMNLGSDAGLPSWYSHGACLAGWAIAERGQLAEGIGSVENGIRNLDAIGTTFHRAHYLGLLAILHAQSGNRSASLDAISEALHQVAVTEENLWHSDLLRTEGLVRLLLGEPQHQAEGYFLQSLNIAREQQAKSFELRASTALARLWRDQGKPQDARDLLAPVYGWFTQGFDTRDLKEAKVLLDVLNGTLSP